MQQGNPGIRLPEAQTEGLLLSTQCALTWHVSPSGEPLTAQAILSEQTQPADGLGSGRSYRETTRFLRSPDLIGFQRMPFPSAGPCAHAT